MSAATMQPTRNRGRAISGSLLAAIALYLALSWWAGGADTVAAARRIGAALLLAGMVLTVANLAVRALRWQFLLHRLGFAVPAVPGAAIYVGGIALSATPGKLGEMVRSAFLLRHGVPVGASVAAFVADRLSDLVAVLLIALLSLALSTGSADVPAAYWTLALVAIGFFVACAAAAPRTALWPRAVARLAGTDFLRGAVNWIDGAAHAFTRLMQPRIFIPSIGASLLAYGLQACTFAAMVAKVAGHVPWTVSAGIFAAALLAGAASFIPGGLGAAELALVFLLRRQGVDAPTALAVALCMRLATFWFSLLCGVIGLACATRWRRE